MLFINSQITIPDYEIELKFIRSSGPGGQNVNKVATAVQLRFYAQRSSVLSGSVKARLKTIAGSRWAGEGEIVITASNYRTQEQNREDAYERLAGLIKKALVKPKYRVATRPTRASKERRLKHKSGRAQVKKMRGRPSGRDD